MIVESGILLHMGINYVITPPPDLDKRSFLAFQTALMDEGIDYGEAKYSEREIGLTREAPPLQIRILTTSQPVGQLLVVSPRPEDGIEIFGRKTEAITNAFIQTWPRSKQIVACDCTIRYLYASERQHAFEEIWEARLKQPKEALSIFEAAVGGGGLRFVMPANPGSANPAEIEVKIESYLKDPRQIYVDTQFKWPQTRQPGASFDPVERLHIVDRFIEEKVITFMTMKEDDA